MTDQQVRLPFRPRLADHVMMRRRVIRGEVKPFLVDTHSGTTYVLTEEELEHVLCMDGTRDFGGILLAAVRAGAFRRASAIEQLLAQLQQASLLVDGIEPPKPALTPDPRRPLEPLESYRLHCDAHGSCCTTFASVPFSQAEAQRALVAAPERVDGAEDRVFLPLWGSLDRSLMAVTMVDGACPFLVSSRCIVHERAGAEAKPLGCQIFPKTYADDGEAVRVSVKVECACVMASALRDDVGEPVDEGASHEGQLDSRILVVRLPEAIPITETTTASRDALRGWSVEVSRAPVEDGIAACWALADAAEAHGLDLPAARLALDSCAPPRPDALRVALEALAKRAAARAEGTLDRLAEDRVRVLSEWANAAAQALTEEAVVARRLARVAHPEQERFYLRAGVWGHHWVQGGSLVSALRDRALRLLLARQMGAEVPRAAAGDPSAPYPITAMEAMMRGQALERYLEDLG